MSKTPLVGLFLAIACGSAPTEDPDAGTEDAAIFDGGVDATDAALDLDAPSPDASIARDLGEGWRWVMGVPIDDIHGSDANAVFAVGADGTIRVHDGRSWSDHPSPTRERIRSVVALSADAVWILVDAPLTPNEIWHFDGSEWTLQHRDDPADWPTDMLALDAEGVLHAARRRYTGWEYWTSLHTYMDGEWVDGNNRVVEEVAPEESFDALRPSLVAYENAFEEREWDRVPTEVWVNGALAAWGSDPLGVLRARRDSSWDERWDRWAGTGFVELDVPLADAESFYLGPQEREVAVAGFADGSTIILHDRQAFLVQVGDVETIRALELPGRPSIKALRDGRVALTFVDEDDVAHVRLLRSRSEGSEHVVDSSECPPNSLTGWRGEPRLVDVDAHENEIWVSVMLDESRTGTPCLLHYDGDSWAARSLEGERFVLQSHGYTISAYDGGVWLAGAGTHDGFEVVQVPRAFMRSSEALLERARVAESAGFRTWMSPRIWRGPTGLWLYENDQALFRPND